jgi:aspartate aminotransferase
MPNAGYPETREAIAAYLAKEFNIPLTFEHIIMTCGAAGALNVIMKTILDPGDEVIIPVPYFVEYEFYVDNAGGIARLVSTKDDFSLDLDAINQAFTERTRAVLINTPNNPTGRVYDEKTIKGLADILRKRVSSTKRQFIWFPMNLTVKLSMMGKRCPPS